MDKDVKKEYLKKYDYPQKFLKRYTNNSIGIAFRLLLKFLRIIIEKRSYIPYKTYKQIFMRY